MDRVDIENLEGIIEEILASHERSKNGTGSEDTVEDLKNDLGIRLGLHTHICNDFNDYSLNHEAVQELEDVGLGTVKFDYGSPKLIIENPENPEDQIEVPIIDPTEQYPDD